MLSLRWRAMVTIETLMGLLMPWSGRISTVPSMRGYQHESAWDKTHGSGPAYQCRRYTRISNQIIGIWATAYSHKGGHVIARNAARPLSSEAGGRSVAEGRWVEMNCCRRRRRP